MDHPPLPQPELSDRATDPSGQGRAVAEGHLVVVTADDRASAVVLRMERRRRTKKARPVEPGGRTMVHVAYLRAGRLPLVIVSDEIQTGHDRWEFRTSGLWAEATCERPGVHWSYGLEAFALAIDETTELLGRGYGLRTPLGWELDFESDQPVEVRESNQDGATGRLWQQPGRATGLLQLLPEPEPPMAGQVSDLVGEGLPAWLAASLTGSSRGETAHGEPDGIDRPFSGPALRRHWWWAGAGPEDQRGHGDPMGALTGWPDRLLAVDEPACRIALPLVPTDQHPASVPDDVGAHRSVWWLGHDDQRWVSEVTTEPGR